MSAWLRLYQEKFVTTVTVHLQKKEGVKYKVKAQWATEDRMRDVLKLREPFSPITHKTLSSCLVYPGLFHPRSRIKAVKEYCEGNSGFVMSLGSFKLDLPGY